MSFLRKYIYQIIRIFLMIIYLPLILIGIVIIPFNIIQGNNEPSFVFRWFHFVLIISFYGIGYFYLIGSFKTYKIIHRFRRRAYLETETFKLFVHLRRCIGGIVLIGLLNLPLFYVFSERRDAPGLFLIAIVLFGFVFLIYLAVIAYYQSLMEIKEYQ